MVTWINERDERNYLNGRLGVKRFNEAISDRRSRHPYDQNSHSEIIEDINTKGYHIIKGAFDVGKLNSLNQEVEEIINSGENLKINNSTNSDDVEEWDSLNHIQLVLSIEKILNVRFKTGEIQSLKDVGEMIDLLEEKVKAN